MDHIVAPFFSLEIILEVIGNNETKMTWNLSFVSIEFLNTMRDFLIEKNGENFDRLEAELKNF